MQYILSIETATKVCSAALFNGSKLIDCIEEDGAYSHSENLAQFIDSLLKRNHINYSELKAIAVTKGPGSYTGLRIGVSLAKGLAYGLNIPLIGIDSLKSLAWRAQNEQNDKNAYYCPMIDARRMEVYSALYNSRLEQIENISANIIEENSYLEQLKHNVIYFFGDGSEKCKAIIRRENARFLQIKSSASNMGALAVEALENTQFEDIAYFEPFYLKQFIANKSKKLI